MGGCASSCGSWGRSVTHCRAASQPGGCAPYLLILGPRPEGQQLFKRSIFMVEVRENIRGSSWHVVTGSHMVLAKANHMLKFKVKG